MTFQEKTKKMKSFIPKLETVDIHVQMLNKSQFSKL